MWSTGVVLGLILTGTALFPSTNQTENLQKIDDFFQSLNMLALDPSAAFKLKFPTANESGMDLLSKLLVRCPEGRLSARDALQHPFVAAAPLEHADYPQVDPNCSCCTGMTSVMRCEFCGHSKKHNTKTPPCEFDRFRKSRRFPSARVRGVSVLEADAREYRKKIK
jgi:serine/threonine protein kinase